MKRILLFCMLTLAISLSTWAQHEYSTLVVETKSGNTFEIWLYEKPQVQIGENGITFTYGKEVTGYVYDKVRKFYFKLYDPISSIEPPMNDDVIRIIYNDQSEVVISGISEEDKVQLYTLDGHCIMSKEAKCDDVLIVPLDELAPGIYILNIGNKQSFKFLKR